ncbi:hypothetical protein QE382_002315 [Sphingobacterium zeae]|uniref:Right handed beta helix region n=1 Tax=Sphingobacterium zeae TaxID=1776859 RepID=A0ABU0U5T7_9SPHI|nr:hypothetical protein [Sphingobacterium zeae]MDQ1150331.1 hypothetical protein [Sphingobacterium zeae]
MANQFLIKNTVQDLRALSSMEISDLQSGVYEGVMLLGYYAKGDTPGPIEYYISNTTDPDNEGSIIVLDSISLRYQSNGECDVRYYGALKGTDSTIQINRCLENERISVISEDYFVDPRGRADGNYTGGIKPQSNSTLIFRNNSKLKSITNSDASTAILNLTKVNNVIINDAYVEGDIETHTGTTGEYGHGIVVYGCENVTLTNPRADKCWGDGFAIATSRNGDGSIVVQNKNVNIYGTLSTYYNRRNGISIISCDALYIQNIDSRYTGIIKGTAPMYGVDIEPNPTGVDIINVVIDNIYTAYNRNGGVEFVPAYMQNAAYNNNGVFNCKVKTIVSEYDGDTSNPNTGGSGAIRFPFVDVTSDGAVETNRIIGKIQIEIITINNPVKQGIVFSRVADTGLTINIDSISIANPQSATESSNRQVKNAISFVQQAVQSTYGHININNVYINDYNNNLITGIYLEPINSSTNKYKNVKINSYTHIGTWSEPIDAPVYCSGSEKSVDIRMSTPVTLNVTTAGLTLSNQTCVSEYLINLKNSSIITLPSLAVNACKRISIYSETPRKTASTVNGRTVDQYINLFPRNNQSINILGESEVNLESYSGIWKVNSKKGNVYAQGFPINGTTASRPVLTTEFSGFQYYDTTLGKPVWWSGTSWVENLQVNATTVTKGIVNQSAPSSDKATSPSPTYTQSEVKEILTELRDLKTKLRAAGILAT